MNGNRIKILPENLANKIAAGEVIERPSSVLKELVENAIDAEAHQITVIIKNGGKTLIQVIDDGSGMSGDDAALALHRHATSKISTYADLEQITTLGFRGEALASIASVSRLELRTCQGGNAESTLVKSEGGKDITITRAAPQKGTTISVKNLFYNTPARRKFLRADATEYRNILSTFNRFTLAFPEIEFKLINGEVEIFDLKSTSPEERINEVLGKRIGANLLPIDDRGSAVTISGKIGNADIARRSRGDQYLFFNRRYIIDRSLNHAILSAYAEITSPGAYPIYVIFLEIDPHRVDVNVHPTKTEVKFADQRLIYDLLRGCVKRALRSPSVIPNISPGHEPGVHGSSPAESLARQTSLELPESEASRPWEHLYATPVSAAKEHGYTGVSSPTYERTNVWQLHESYIISEIKSGLIVIDQHIAHERILYEKALADFRKSTPSPQQLLFPQTVELSAEDHHILLEILPFLGKLGFIIKAFGARTVIVEGVPSGARIGSEEKVLINIIDDYKNNRKAGSEIRESVAKAYACRSAIKAGEKLSLETMNSLIDQLFATENPYFCPHGRPIVINISLEELNKRFKR